MRTARAWSLVDAAPVGRPDEKMTATIGYGESWFDVAMRLARRVGYEYVATTQTSFLASDPREACIYLVHFGRHRELGAQADLSEQYKIVVSSERQ